MQRIDAEIDRCSGVSMQQFHAKYLHPERPVILTDQLCDWPATREWSISYLVREHGDRPISAYHHPEGLYTAWKRMRLNTTLGAVLTDQDPRTFVSAEVMPECPYLMKDFARPSVVRPQWVVDEASVWFQPRGNRTGLHWDSYNSLICVVRGAKRVLLFSPEQVEVLKPCSIMGPDTLTRGSWSEIDIFDPDLDAHPSVAAARYHEVEVREGEVLLVPRHWWHAVENLGEPTMAVSFFLAAQGKEELTFYSDRRRLGALAYRLGLQSSREDHTSRESERP